MNKNKIDQLIVDCSDNKCESLRLVGLNFKEIPREVFEFKHLKSLELTKNRITILPAQIGNLTDLEFLGLNYNFIEYLLTEIGNLSKLKSFILSKNRLKSLPDKLFDEIKKEIEKYSNEVRMVVEDKIAEIEYLLKNQVEEKVIKSKYKSLKDLLIGVSDSSISTELVKLFKLFI